MEISNKINRQKIIKSLNRKAFIYKSPSFNKSSYKPKHNTEFINLHKSNYKTKLIYNNLKKYNISAEICNKYIINDIIFDHRNHIVAVFKNYLLWDETSEFLKRYYTKRDIVGRLPKISEYYVQYTLFTPNYLANDGLLIIIMIKWIKRKKKYLQFLEEKEEEERNNKNKKNINQNFEPLFSEEIISLTRTKSKSFFSSGVDLSRNTLELTTFDKETNNNKRKNSHNKLYKNKNDYYNKDNDFKNSISFTEIFDDLSSHFSVLINSNNYKDCQKKNMPIKNLGNKKITSKKEIMTKNNSKKTSPKKFEQKSLNKKTSFYKQKNVFKKEKEKEKEIIAVKKKEVQKLNKNIQKKTYSKKKVLSKEKNKIEKEKIIDTNKENNKLLYNNKDIKKYQKVSIVNINLKENKDISSNNNLINKVKMKNINILNSNSGKNKKKIDCYDENINTMNTIANINPQYYSLGKLMKNNKQSSAIKKMNMKSLNLLNFNQNIIPNLKKLVNNQRDKKIIFPRNFNLMYNNNTNKANINRDNYGQMKLLTDRDKENNKRIINTNENSKYIKFNDNTSINNKNNNNANIYFDQNDLFARKVTKLIKKNHKSLFGDNLSFKEPNNSNILLYKNENNEKVNINNISNLNNLRYKKNSVLRQFNSKRDFNFSNSKNNILKNYNNLSNNSINSSSSSLNSLNKQKHRLSNYLSQNNSFNKKKSLQKINLNLNLQINFNINLDKNKKLILGKRLNNRIFNEITNNKNFGIQNIKKDDNNNSNNINVPLTQRCYYNINQYKKYLGEQRSSSSSNSKTKKRIKN